MIIDTVNNCSAWFFDIRIYVLTCYTYDWIRSATEFFISSMFGGYFTLIVVNVVFVEVGIVLELLLKVSNVALSPLVVRLCKGYSSTIQFK